MSPMEASFSPPLRGGVAARLRKMARSHLRPRRRVVANLQQRIVLVFTHHPVCGHSERDHFLMPQPPLLGEEGKNSAHLVFIGPSVLAKDRSTENRERTGIAGLARSQSSGCNA